MLRGWVVGGLLLTAVACGSSSRPTPAASDIDRDRATVEAQAKRLLEPFHLSIQRWSIERRVQPPRPWELSLYSQPARTEAPAAYARRFVPLAAAVVPALFQRYPDIAWVDLCQEQANVPHSAWEPTPVTRLELSRAAAARIDWAHADIAALLAENRAHPGDLQIETHSGVAATPAWRAATAKLGVSGG